MFRERLAHEVALEHVVRLAHAHRGVAARKRVLGADDSVTPQTHHAHELRHELLLARRARGDATRGDATSGRFASRVSSSERVDAKGANGSHVSRAWL